MSKNIRRLPESELEVMQALWDCKGPALRSDIEKKLPKSHPIAATTVLTQLTRLGEKGFLLIEKEGRRSVYTPLVTRSEYLAAESENFFTRLCKGSVSTFAAALCDSGLTKEELSELRELLEKGEL